jgi:hypothetical protein
VCHSLNEQLLAIYQINATSCIVPGDKGGSEISRLDHYIPLEYLDHLHSPSTTMLLTTKAMRPARQLARTMASVSRTGPPPHLLTLADLSPAQITSLIQSAITFKHLSKTVSPTRVEQTLDARTVALLFSKRSTRTRVASETSAKILGGHPLFLGSADSQLGVNESLEDTARVVGSMVDGIMARVNLHDEVAVCPF